ncbi:MAG: N-acetylmuramoyl-L-alanine amidase [Lysobacteraceae bacterium]
MNQIKSVDFIVVHSSATRSDMDWDVSDVRRAHLQRGWLDVGYHFVIKRDGTVQPGRPLDTPGAHVRGLNHRSIGICCIGGLAPDGKSAEDNFTDEQRDALLRLLVELKTNYPKAEVTGHRDHAATLCPSWDVKSWFADRYTRFVGTVI